PPAAACSTVDCPADPLHLHSFPTRRSSDLWTGADAVSNGLVDELGGLDVALKHAAEAANIIDYKTVELPGFEKDFDKILRGFGLVKAKEDILKEEIGAENYKLLKRIKSLSEKKGVQLLFHYSLEIK